MSAKQPWLKRKLGMVNQNLAEELTDAFIDKVESKLIQNKFNLM
jgi:hypothetical protein